MVENARLSYIRHNQKTLCCIALKNLNEAIENGNEQVSDMGNRIVLPSSFTGGARYMRENYLDAMAIVRAYGYPDLFVTFTCNPKWPEILRFLEPQGLKPEDMPDIVTRVYKVKLDMLLNQIQEKKFFGEVSSVIAVVEFQKRGLPHCHICVFLEKTSMFQNPVEIDQVITAEIPDKDEDPELYAIVSDFMIHGPCGPDHPYGVWMKPTERCIMWVGGFRPSDILKLIYAHVYLTHLQSKDIKELQSSTIHQESKISNSIVNIEQKLAARLASDKFKDKGDGLALTNYMAHISQSMGNFNALETYLHQADELRLKILSTLQQLLTTKQFAESLSSINEYFRRIEATNYA